MSVNQMHEARCIQQMKIIQSKFPGSPYLKVYMDEKPEKLDMSDVRMSPDQEQYNK